MKLMKLKRFVLKLGIWIGGAIILLTLLTYIGSDRFAQFGAAPSGERQERIESSSQFDGGYFKNMLPPAVGHFETFSDAMSRFMFGDELRVPQMEIPIVRLDSASFSPKPESGLRITWLGHSTVLIELDDYRILTDPVWTERISPVNFFGPRRFHPPPVALDDLPPIDLVVVSHDHFDHLDMNTIIQLAERGAHFVLPLGVGAHLESWGIGQGQFDELDWWESWKSTTDDLEITATPARHFSGRGPNTINHTLWASWVIVDVSNRVYFSGDTGPFPGFEEIGQRLGPFDITLIKIGAYDESWPDIHLNPPQALDAHQLLRGRLMQPIHWGTFNLAYHDWYEPAAWLLAEAVERQISIVIPRPGEMIEPAMPNEVEEWWLPDVRKK